MTPHRQTRSPPLALGIAAIASAFIVVVGFASRGVAASQEEVPIPSPTVRDNVLPRFWDWLQKGGDNEEEGDEAVADEHREQPPSYLVMERNQR